MPFPSAAAHPVKQMLVFYGDVLPNIIFGWHVINVNPYRAGTELIQFNIVNIMVADALAPSVARTSAPMILTMWSR